MVSFNSIISVFKYCFSRHPHFYTPKKTIKKVLEGNKSLSRFGDGELLYMLGSTMVFEKADEKGAQMLRGAFNTRNEQVLICLTSGINFKPFRYTNDIRSYYKDFLLANWANIKTLIDFKYKYGDNLVTRFYIDYKHKNRKKIAKYVDYLKKMWEGRNVIFVEGPDSKLGVGNDLFDNTKSKRRIICPPKNSIEKVSIIKEAIIKNYNEGDLILLALGPAASYISATLPIEENIQCLDLGHVDVEYIWFLNGVKERVDIKYKRAAESTSDKQIDIFFDEKKYKSEIICTIE